MNLYPESSKMVIMFFNILYVITNLNMFFMCVSLV